MSPMISRSFLITSADAESLRTAAEREGCTAAEFIRRAVAARVNGTTSTAGASLGTSAQLQAAVAAFVAAQEQMEETNNKTREIFLKQIEDNDTIGRRLGAAVKRLEAPQS